MLEIGMICAEAGEKKEETTGTGDASETIADAASNAASSSADRKRTMNCPRRCSRSTMARQR